MSRFIAYEILYLYVRKSKHVKQQTKTKQTKRTERNEWKNTTVCEMGRWNYLQAFKFYFAYLLLVFIFFIFPKQPKCIKSVGAWKSAVIICCAEKNEMNQIIPLIICLLSILILKVNAYPKFLIQITFYFHHLLSFFFSYFIISRLWVIKFRYLLIQVLKTMRSQLNKFIETVVKAIHFHQWNLRDRKR